ncbi:E3 SUMO-protein ligase ZBED1-like [Festucalex cinctus]
MDVGASSSETDYICNAPATFKSYVWKHYGFAKKDGKLDKTFVICKECRVKKPYNGSTTNMQTHLKRIHHIADSTNKCTTAASASSSSSDTGDGLSKSGQEDKKSFTSYFGGPLAGNSDRAMAITKAIAYFICKDMQPYSVVENEGFRQLVHVLEPRYKIPDRSVFTDKHISDLYNKVRSEIVVSLNSAQRVALTVDGWTSCATDSYITVTAHHIDMEWEMQNFVLQTRAFRESHTGANLAELLRDVSREWKIGDKKPALVTDNATNMILAGSAAEMKPHVRCIAHTLNLSSQKTFKVDQVKPILVKIRRIVTFFHKSTKASDALRDQQHSLGLAHHKLIHDVSTRWNSSLEMLERFWEQKDAVAAVLRKIKPRGEPLPALSDNEIKVIPEIVKLMSPLKLATKLLSEEKTPTLSIVSPLLAKLRSEFGENHSDLAVIGKMKENFRQDFESRYNYIQDFLNNASALDPRFKDLHFMDADNTVKDVIFLRIADQVEDMARADGMLDDESQAAQAEGDGRGHREEEDDNEVEEMEEDERDEELEPPKKRSAMDQLLGGFLAPVRRPQQTIRERAKEEITKYRGRDGLDVNGDVLQWWKEQVDLPLLSKLARSYLSIPATSVPSERVFSTAGDIITAERSRLLPEHVDQLIFLKKNLKQHHMKCITK